MIIISLAVGYGALTHGGFPGRNHAFAAPVSGLSMPGVNTNAPVTDVTVLRAPAINKTLRVEQPPSTQEKQEAEQFAAIGATPTPIAPAEDALVRAAAVAPAPALPPYQIYTVVEGDTVGTIASKFGVDSAYIVANNAEIRDTDLLTLGQSIIIPAGNGILHEVRYGETLSDIATRYDVQVDAITGFAPNGIETPDDISETQLVYVPGAALPEPPAAAPTAEPAPLAGPVDTGDAGNTGGPGPAPAASDPPADANTDTGGGGGGGIVGGGPSSAEGLIWPIRGPISSYYGPSHPLGIDIDGYNLVGSPIAAATSGTVVFAGGNACCSYGLYVVVMSPGGIETLYAHLSSISVSAGQSVAQGEELGIIGSTGYSTGTHLHFEVIDNGTREDPLDYLPA